MTKLQINALKLTIATGCFDQKTQMERMYLLSCEVIGNEANCLFEMQKQGDNKDSH